MPPRPARARRALVGAAVVALAATGCSVPNPFDRGSSVTSTPLATSEKVPQGQQALERFYTQEITWTECGGPKCGKLTVPIDYSKPDGATIQLSVLKVEKRGSGAKAGSLVVNPGGPGGSGVDYAKYADFIVGTPVRKAYDVVGFDPRGVQSSAPIECVQPAQMDTFLGQDPTPDDAAERDQAVKLAKDFGASCEKNAGALLGHVSTVEAAKDMDILRAVLGDAKLNYLGKSYGTYLGATYAGLFPARVGRFVLDGALAPDLSAEEVAIGQARGFDTATKAWAADCVDQGKCPLGSSTEQVMTKLAALLATLDKTPATVSGDARITKLTEGWASYGVAAAMYDQGMWSQLTDALRAVVDSNDGSGLMELADAYAERNSSGSYTGNMMQVIYAVNCLDSPDSKDVAVYEAREKKAAEQAPLFGRLLAWSGLTCGYWPIQTQNTPAKITASGSGPIVVVGTTRDPATPYEWAVRLADQLASGVLVTMDGDGHTAYMRANSCIDNAINDYYVKDKVPADGLSC
ncbi:MAG: alpha/beta hydrolase [Actinobacteria bacterium]|uniref:Alpha/beta hydrolase n=1 Tax=Nostocoides veronense TaxID=330836 RepID=A0ABN2L9L5_9MICO|nr:alpha/beta hydrolase [Actinomycetota bacterium]